MDSDELAPPWQVFPEIAPDDLAAHTRQGRAETYFDALFRPFWAALSPEERTQYCDHWHASPAWREALTMFDVDPTLDLAADARESEAYLAEHPAPARRAWWKRWFRRD